MAPLSRLLAPCLLASCLLASLLLDPCSAGTFWHLSDLHLDYQYVTGGNTSSWCHASSLQNSTSTQHPPAAGPDGDYNCDSPYSLVMSALQAMARLQPSPDFIVWTGDSAPHWSSPHPPDQEYIFNVTKAVFSRLDQLFPGVPVVPALGNHDSSPPDQFPVSTGEEKTPSYYQDLWRQGAFGDHIEPEGRQTFEQCGYFTRVLNLTAATTVRFVVLNTNIYYSDNYTTGPDPCGQLEWLDKTLEAAVETKVFIVAHVPPGSFERGGKDGFEINFNTPSDTAHDINKKYVQIVSKKQHADKISAHLYGHLHTDTFRLFLDRATGSTARGVAFMAASVTPVVWGKNGADPVTGVIGVNPTVRLFTYRDSDVLLQDYSEYFLDLEEAPTPSLAILPDSGPAKSRRKQLEGDRRRRREVTEVTTALPLGTEQTTGAQSTNITEDASNTTEVPSNTTENTSNKTETNELEENTTKAAAIELEPTTTGPVNETATEEKDSIKNTTDPLEEDPTKKTTDPLEDPSIKATISQLSLRWKLLYTASSALQVPDLSPASVLALVKRMAGEGYRGQVFQTYYSHNTAGHRALGVCTQTCWREHLCTITKLVQTELDSCLAANDKEGFFYEASQARLTTTTESHVTNDNDNLTIPPYPTPSVNIEVSTSPPVADSDSPQISPVPGSGTSITAGALSVFFGLVGLLVVGLIVSLGCKKYRDSRHRNQEFLLTDSVFRYDGYSQLDDD